MAAEQLDHHDYIDIYNGFAATPYGTELSQQVRYGKYNLSQLQPEQWTEILGPDVNNLEHMRVTYQLTQAFVRYSQANQPELLSDSDTKLLLVAAISHDQGEAMVGDISFGDKTVADTIREHKEFAEHASEFVPDASILLRHFLARARDEIIFDATTRLGRIFNAVERIGYLRTALRASQYLQADTTSDVAPGLRWLIADVLSNQTETLLVYAHDYAAVHAYLQHNAAAITTAFEGTTPDVFRHYNTREQSKLTQFESARRAWHDQPAADSLRAEE